MFVHESFDEAETTREKCIVVRTVLSVIATLIKVSKMAVAVHV